MDSNEVCARMLSWGEQMDVDRALKLVLGLAS